MKKNLNHELNNIINNLLNNNNNNKNTLVLCGGGIRGVAHLGVMKYLEDSNILQSITTFIGTSVGALINALYILGYSIDELYEIISSLDLSKYIHINLFELVSEYGVDNATGLKHILIEMFKNKKIDINIDLENLYLLTKKELIITTVCINTKSLCYLSHKTYPKIPLLTAILMSISIPFLFTPVLYNNNYYCDGGLMNNYPINYLSNIKNCIGVCFESQTNNDTSINSFIDYLKNIMSCHLSKINKKKYSNTLYIPLSVSAFSFDISLNDKKMLFEQGYNYCSNNYNIIFR